MGKVGKRTLSSFFFPDLATKTLMDSDLTFKFSFNVPISTRLQTIMVAAHSHDL